MTQETKSRIAFLVVLAISAAVLAILTLWALSGKHSRLQYLVGGTLATSVLLAAAFFRIAKMGYLGRPRRAGSRYPKPGADLPAGETNTGESGTPEAEPPAGETNTGKHARVAGRIVRRSE